MIALLVLVATIVVITLVRVVQEPIIGIILLWVSGLMLGCYTKYMDTYISWVVFCVSHWYIAIFYLLILAVIVFFYIKFRRCDLIRIILMAVIMLIIPPVVFFWVAFQIIGMLKTILLP